MSLRSRPAARWACAALLAAGSGISSAETGGLRDELQELASRGGFALEGLDRIGTEPARGAGGAPAETLRSLLRDYNYVLVQGKGGRIEKLRIAGRKDSDNPRSADSATVGTVRLGAHHRVEAAIAGPSGVARTLSLIVDTGASTLVLPASLIPELGFAPEDLRDGVSQTASGQVAVRIGRLRSVRVGAVAESDVEASFIADARLQGALLLGMSFLQRFRVTIDDARNELILLAK